MGDAAGAGRTVSHPQHELRVQRIQHDPRGRSVWTAPLGHTIFAFSPRSWGGAQLCLQRKVRRAALRHIAAHQPRRAELKQEEVPLRTLRSAGKTHTPTPDRASPSLILLRFYITRLSHFTARRYAGNRGTKKVQIQCEMRKESEKDTCTCAVGCDEPLAARRLRQQDHYPR